jgi:hypothetical protein
MRIRTAVVFSLLAGCQYPPVSPEVAVPGAHHSRHRRHTRKDHSDGWVTIRESTIAAVSTERPQDPGAVVLETNDVLLRAWSTLHNHPMYDAFTRWVPPRTYPNRYEWRYNSPEYREYSKPFGKLIQENFLRHRRVLPRSRPLIGGTTSIAGISAIDADMSCLKGLVRNLDRYTGFHGSEVNKSRSTT